MKNILATGLLVALFIGCGPSAEQLNTIKNLTTEVMNLTNGASDQLGKVDGIMGMIGSALTEGGMLAQKFPKDAATIQGAVDQLKSSQNQLTSVKDEVSNWISNFKAPSLENMNFEEALKGLTTSKDEITAASGKLTDAIGAATSAVDNYKGIAGGFLEKLAAMTKKK
jgi:prefoldin subunit 5